MAAYGEYGDRMALRYDCIPDSQRRNSSISWRSEGKNNAWRWRMNV